MAFKARWTSAVISAVVGNSVLMGVSLWGFGSVEGDGAQAEGAGGGVSDACCCAAYSSVGSAIDRPITSDSVSMSYGVPSSSSSRVPSSVRFDWKIPAADRGRKSS